MQILVWLARILVVVLVVWFAAKNADPVVLRGYLDAEIRAPLVLILLAFFACGLLLGLGASLLQLFRLKREIRNLNRILHRHRADAPAVPGED